jgi:hypothetical protein
VITGADWCARFMSPLLEQRHYRKQKALITWATILVIAFRFVSASCRAALVYSCVCLCFCLTWLFVRVAASCTSSWCSRRRLWRRCESL